MDPAQLRTWQALPATAARYTLFREDRRPNDHEWVCIAGGALPGGLHALKVVLEGTKVSAETKSKVKERISV